MHTNDQILHSSSSFSASVYWLVSVGLTMGWMSFEMVMENREVFCLCCHKVKCEWLERFMVRFMVSKPKNVQL